jgi:hypothetical protein
MKKLVFLALLAVSACSQAIVLTSAFFNTAVTHIETFDAIPAGSYPAQTIFSPPTMIGTVYALNFPNLIDIAPPPFWQPPAFNPPHTMLGNNTDIGLRVTPPQRRLGAYFRACPDIFGIAPTGAQLDFYQGATFLGSGTILSLTGTWTWYGFMSVPQLYDRVEIYGIGNVGWVEMDELRVRPF